MLFKKNKIIIISGPSGVGKKSVIEPLLQDPNLLLTYSVSMTTRKPRNNEINGKDYFFVSEKEFNDAIYNHQLVEWVEFANSKYGTPLKNLYQNIQDNKNVLLEIEVIGANRLRHMLNKNDYISIFIIPPSIAELKRRLIHRNSETLEKINKRITRAKTELKYQNEYDFVVLNDEIIKATNKIREIIIQNLKTNYT